MDARDWLVAYAERLGVEPPDDAAIEQLLDLAGIAAHTSERIAAPITCWLVGSSGTPVGEALEIGRQLADEAATA